MKLRGLCAGLGFAGLALYFAPASVLQSVGLGNPLDRARGSSVVKVTARAFGQNAAPLDGGAGLAGVLGGGASGWAAAGLVSSKEAQ